MEFNPPFPNEEMSLMLRNMGWQESDIMDIREMLMKEIKCQNDKEVEG